MNINDVYQSSSNFLRAVDLKGQTVPLIISEIGTHTFNEGKPDQKTQIILSFQGKEKKLGLNATNARTIGALLGENTDSWVGKEIKIYPTKTDFAGEMVDCIRIVQDVPPEAGFDDIPFQEVFMNIYLDIETIPQQPEAEVKAEIAKTIEAPKTISKPETIQEWHEGKGKYAGVKDAAIEDAYRKTSLDGSKGQICSIAYATDTTGPESISIGNFSEYQVIDGAFFHISNILAGESKTPREPFFIGHYIGGFDLKFLWQRAVILGIKPPFKLPFDGRHGSHYYCTMQAWAGFKERISQDNLCKALGIEGKPDDIDGSKVWDFVKAGNIDRVAEYNRDDVEKVRMIYNRLNFI